MTYNKDYVEVVRAHDKIIHFYYACGRKMWRALGRLQALYDAPPEKFRSYHTRQEFEDWAQNYPLWGHSWVGCNIPASVAYELDRFPDLDEEERFVVDAVKAANLPEGSYIITSSEWNGALRHEICHALWYCFEDYREECLAVLNAPENREDREYEFKELRRMGYKESSLHDEANAYIAGSSNLSRSMNRALGDLLDTYLEKSGIDFKALMELGQDQRSFGINKDHEPELIDPDEYDDEFADEFADEEEFDEPLLTLES